MNVSQLITVKLKELIATDHLYDQYYRIRLQDQHRVKTGFHMVKSANIKHKVQVGLTVSTTTVRTLNTAV